MTFIAQSDDGPVAPEEVGESDRLECVECAESLSIVHSHTRADNSFVSRHFRHPPAGSCGGGESDTHKAMKSIALSKLKEVYPEYAHAALEQTIGDRQADAYLRFEEPHDKLGYGVIAEAQYRHKDKDIEATTTDYLDAGYSVFWLYEDDYDDLDVELGDPVSVWPNAVPGFGEWFWQSERCYYIPTRRRHLPEATQRQYTAQCLGVSYVVWEDGEKPVLFPPKGGQNIQLPREFYEDCAREWFRDTPWHELFSGYEWDARTSLPTPGNGTKRNGHVDAVYHHGWDIDEVAVFRRVPWRSLFSDCESPDELIRAEAGFEQPSVERKVSLPEEFYDDHEDEYRRAHLIGSGDFELNYRLKPNNAGRRCSDCGEAAIAYLFTEGYVSKFVCGDCHPDEDSSSRVREADREVVA